MVIFYKNRFFNTSLDYLLLVSLKSRQISVVSLQEYQRSEYREAYLSEANINCISRSISPAVARLCRVTRVLSTLIDMSCFGFSTHNSAPKGEFSGPDAGRTEAEDGDNLPSSVFLHLWRKQLKPLRISDFVLRISDFVLRISAFHHFSLSK